MTKGSCCNGKMPLFSCFQSRNCCLLEKGFLNGADFKIDVHANSEDSHFDVNSTKTGDETKFSFHVKQALPNNVVVALHKNLPDGKVEGTLSHTGIVPGLKASIKAESCSDEGKCCTATVGTEYRSDAFSIGTSFSSAALTARGSALFGISKNILIGGETEVAFAGGAAPQLYSAGAAYYNSQLSVGATFSQCHTDGTSVRLTGHSNVNEQSAVGFSVKHNVSKAEMDITIGGKTQLDKTTSFKAKATGKGLVDILLSHKHCDNVSFTVGSSFNARNLVAGGNSACRVGLGIVIGSC